MGFVDAFADPAHDWHSHRVAQCLVSRPVRALIGGFVSPGDEGVVVGEPLKAFAFRGGETTDRLLRGNGRGMRSSGKRLAGITGLWVAVVGRAGGLGGVEGYGWSSSAV
jgi:hypothetical protein